jgi:hypothetical protein
MIAHPILLLLLLNVGARTADISACKCECRLYLYANVYRSFHPNFEYKWAKNVRPNSVRLKSQTVLESVVAWCNNQKVSKKPYGG